MNPESTTTSQLPRWVIAALVVHVLVIGGGVAWSAIRFQELQELRVPPQPTIEPLRIEPRYDNPDTISDADLQAVLHHLRPRLRHDNPLVNHVDHALRFWGVEAKFNDPECLSGMEMRDLLLDMRRFSKVWQRGTKPLLAVTSDGLLARTQSGAATSSHVDHTLACLAEVGTPLDFPIILRNGERRVEDLYRHAFHSFSLNQTEYEWSTLIFVLYGATDRPWYTAEGQQISFDVLAERLMRQAPTQGVCAGNHRLHTLTVLLLADEQKPVLSAAMRKKVVAHLKEMTDTLVAHQDNEGWWELNWDGGEPPEVEIKSGLSRQILATGHALEWWAFAPKEVQPPRETLLKATHWLRQAILKLSDREVTLNYTFLTHAGRALALWRGKFPAQVYQAPADEKTEQAGLDPQPLKTESKTN